MNVIILLGRVAQIVRGNEFIYVNVPVSISAGTLKFRRNGQNIVSFFDNHTRLGQVYLRNCKIIGTIPLFSNCRNLGYVYLGDNLLTIYQSGTLKNITGAAVGVNSTPPLRRFFLERNALSKQSIKNIINDVFDVAVYFRARNIRPNFTVGLLSTKYDSVNKQYQNWTRAEIFDQGSTSINAAGETITIPDPLETKFNQLGAGNTHSSISIQLF